MKEIWRKIELLIDEIIPYSLLVLFLLIIAEVSFAEQVDPYYSYITAVDYTIIAIFVVDLIFKYVKVRKIPLFLRKYWLDILAVFPFFLVFRIFEGIYVTIGTSTLVREPQALFHGGLELLEMEGSELVKAVEKAGRISRTRLLFRFIRPIQRLPRFLKIIPYFEKPTEEHHRIIRMLSREKRRQKE